MVSWKKRQFARFVVSTTLTTSGVPTPRIPPSDPINMLSCDLVVCLCVCFRLRLLLTTNRMPWPRNRLDRCELVRCVWRWYPPPIVVVEARLWVLPQKAASTIHCGCCCCCCCRVFVVVVRVRVAMVATRQSRSPILFHNDTICRGELAMIACRVVVVVAVAIPPRQAKQNYWLLLCGQSQYPVGCCCCGQSQNILFGLDDVGVPGGCIVLSSTSRYVITGHPVGSSVRTDDDAGLNQNMTNHAHLWMPHERSKRKVIA